MKIFNFKFYSIMTKQEVAKIARLARLELTDKELNKYANQLSQILSYVDQLNEVDTADVDPISQITGLTNIWREDKVEESTVIDDLLAQVPELEARGVKVKSVF